MNIGMDRLCSLVALFLCHTCVDVLALQSRQRLHVAPPLRQVDKKEMDSPFPASPFCPFIFRLSRRNQPEAALRCHTVCLHIRASVRALDTHTSGCDYLPLHGARRVFILEVAGDAAETKIDVNKKVTAPESHLIAARIRVRLSPTSPSERRTAARRRPSRQTPAPSPTQPPTPRAPRHPRRSHHSRHSLEPSPLPCRKKPTRRPEAA